MAICQFRDPLIQLNREGTEEDLKYLCLQVSIQPLLFHHSRVHVFLHRKFVDISIQPVFNLLPSWIPVMRHHTSRDAYPVPATEPFVGLMGPNPGSALISQENPYTTSHFSINLWSVELSIT